MANVDTDPFCDHNKPEVRLDEAMGETIPLTPGGIGGSSFETRT